MKRDEETKKVQTADTTQHNEEGRITSASVENAHATGDGAVKKTDELLPADDNEETSTNKTPY